MKNLIKAELYSLWAGKRAILICVVNAVFACVFIMLPEWLGESPEDISAVIPMLMLFAAMFFGSISISEFVRDFQYNTIRNKITSGHSKTQIYWGSM